MAKSRNAEQNDFSDLSAVYAVTLIVNTAIVPGRNGHPVRVWHSADPEGVWEIVIWIPGFWLEYGQIIPVPV